MMAGAGVGGLNHCARGCGKKMRFYKREDSVTMVNFNCKLEYIEMHL